MQMLDQKRGTPLSPGPHQSGKTKELRADQAGVEAPVRLAMAGRRGSGKSSIINLLLGSDVLSTGDGAETLAPIVMRFGTEERTIAEWWDRAGQSFAGVDLPAALNLQPDLITFELNCEALQDLWLIDLPALEDDGHNREALFALSQLADVMVWCANGCAFADHDDAKFRARIPARLTRHATLALTHMDVMTEAQDDAVQAKLQTGHSLPFNACIPIATPLAQRALEGGADLPPTLWTDSGAEELIGAIFDMVTAFREECAQRVAREIGKADVAAQDQPTNVTPPATDQEEHRDPKVNGLTEILETWRASIADLLTAIEREEIADNADLINALQARVAAFLESLADADTLPPEAAWLVEEFERADNLLVLLQFEDADEVVADAARILVQLSDCLADA